MTPEHQRLQEIAEQARGRCHSCLHSRYFDMPSGTRYWCRAFNVEMEEDKYRGIRNCPRWRAYAPPGQSLSTIARNPLLKDLIDSEDLLFWRLKYHLEENDLDLKTVIALAHPGTSPSRDLNWVATLDPRFEDHDPESLQEVLSELRALGYLSLCSMVERIVINSEGQENA